MTNLDFPIPRVAVHVATKINDPASALGRASLLYVALLPLASKRGVVIRTRMFLAQTLSVSEADIDRWLSRLQKTGLVVLRTPPPYLVIKLCFWSGRGSEEAENASLSSSKSGSLQDNGPVSSSSKQLQPAADLLKSRASGDGGPGEGADLLAEARRVLVADDDRLDELLAEYDESVVRRALARVEATPDRQIRKSRLALFRYLLAKFTNDGND